MLSTGILGFGCIYPSSLLRNDPDSRIGPVVMLSFFVSLVLAVLALDSFRRAFHSRLPGS